MDFGINYESAEEIMRGGMSNIRDITDLNKESIKSFMHGLKSISPDCPNPKSIHYGNRLSSRLLTWANWARYQPLIGVKPRAIDWEREPKQSGIAAIQNQDDGVKCEITGKSNPTRAKGSHKIQRMGGRLSAKT
eukprot:jgi/Psemu1/13295/gm1.13295_g